MGGIHLRPASAGDLDFFFDLHRRTLGPYVDRVWGWRDHVQRAYLERTMDVEATQVIVDGGVDVGRLDLQQRGDHVYVRLIEIDPSRQGRGMGSLVVDNVVESAFALGKGVRLKVLGVNVGAQRLYGRLGFREVSREGSAPAIRIHMWAHPTTAGGDDRGSAKLWRLRDATADDRDFIVEMARHACVIEDRPLPDADSDDVQSLVPESDGLILVATDVLGRPAAAAWTFHHDPPLLADADGAPVPELCIAVVPETRGLGAGRTLLAELVQRCAARHDLLCLNVHERNTAARNLYSRAGFHEVGRGRGSLGVAMRLDPSRDVASSD